MRTSRVLLALAAVALLAGGAWAGPLVGGNLLLYYSFDEVGTTVADGSGHGYDGTVVNKVAATTGISGGAAQFSAVTDGLYNYVDVPVASIPSSQIPTSNFTLAVWYNIAAAGGDNATLCPRATDGTWLLHAEIKNDKYRFTARGAGATTIGTYYPGDDTGDDYPLYGDWHHIAFTYNQSAHTMAFYLDGALLEAKTDCGDYALPSDWGLGARVGCNIDNARQFIGGMDEMYVFSRTLSADEINHLYTLVPVPEPSTIALLVGAGLGALVLAWRRRK